MFFISRFRTIRRNLNYLLPPPISNWLSAHHFERFVVELVDQLNLKDMMRAYSASSIAPFHSASLLSILVYGYATGVFSRESVAYDSAAFRFLTSDEHPDHSTLNTFRKCFLKDIEVLITGVQFPKLLTAAMIVLKF